MAPALRPFIAAHAVGFDGQGALWRNGANMQLLRNLGFDGKLHWFHFSDSEYFVDVGISTGHMQAYNKKSSASMTASINHIFSIPLYSWRLGEPLGTDGQVAKKKRLFLSPVDLKHMGRADGIILSPGVSSLQHFREEGPWPLKKRNRPANPPVNRDGLRSAGTVAVEAARSSTRSQKRASPGSAHDRVLPAPSAAAKVDCAAQDIASYDILSFAQWLGDDLNVDHGPYQNVL